MSATKYIRPMSFRGILGSTFQVLGKIIVPALVLNAILAIIGTFLGMVAIVGPILLVSSNAILGKPLKIWNSTRQGIFSGAFIKIVALSVVYAIFTYLVAFIVLFVYFLSSSASGNPDAQSAVATNISIALVAGFHVLLDPIFIFIPMIMLLEKKGLREAIRRSFQILRANFSRTVQMVFFIAVVLGVFTLLLGLLIADFVGAFLLVNGVATFCGFTVLPYVFLYYEYRARHENYSDELLAEEVGYQPIEEMLTA